MTQDILVSADGHIIEPIDLFKTRLPKRLRDRAVYEEDFELEPLGDDDRRFFRRMHAPGIQRWSYSQFRHYDGSPNTGQPDQIIEDMDKDGIWAQVMHPNLTLVWIFTDDHEFSMAHARAYNDYVAETFSAYRDRMAPTAPVPLTHIPDAVAEIERDAKLGFRAILLPAVPPAATPYYSPELDPVWAAARANGLTVMFHVASGGISVQDEQGPVMQGMLGAVATSRDMSEKNMVDRIVGQAALGPIIPQTIVSSLVGGGVMERFPDLHFVLVEFNAHWLASLMGGMDKAWTLGIGQDPDYWVGEYEDGRTPGDQPMMGRLFRVNEMWPYPLRPSEYVKRQIHVSFQDDPVAVACRHVTGISSVVWGSDYPHAEGTFGRSHEAVAQLFDGVDPLERAAILGGTMAKLLGFRAPVPA